MEVTPEIKAALVIVSGIWAAELKDVTPAQRKAAVSKWAKRHDVIYQALLAKFQAQ